MEVSDLYLCRKNTRLSIEAVDYLIKEIGLIKNVYGQSREDEDKIIQSPLGEWKGRTVEIKVKGEKDKTMQIYNYFFRKSSIEPIDLKKLKEMGLVLIISKKQAETFSGRIDLSSYPKNLVEITSFS